MGYHRPVASFNRGKQGEYAERTCFTEDRCRRSTRLRVGGLVPLSSVDWPGELAATVFTQGCPWDCPYCHNPHLLRARPARRRTPSSGTAVVGVPATRASGCSTASCSRAASRTAQAALADAMREVRELGFRVALHTGGPVPARVR